MSDPTGAGHVRRTCITVDLENYSRLDGPTQEAAQRGLADALNAAGSETGLRRLTWRRQDGGDGELAVLPPEEDEAAAVGTFPTAVDKRLKALHAREGLRLRARMAINHGMVAPGAMGHAGWGPCDVARLVDAPAVRQALKEISEAHIVLVLSAEIYRDLVKQGHTALQSDQFRQVPVPRIDATAWVTIPGVDPERIPTEAVDEPEEQGPPAPVHQQTAATTGSTVVQSGRDTTGNVIGSNNHVVNSHNSNSPVNNLHIGPRHGG